MIVQLHRRISTPKQTLGDMYVFDENKMIFHCKTLELPWLENKSRVSCIPKGNYECKYTVSPRFKRKLYLITNVPNRSGVRIHPGNYYTQIQGCILVGDVHKDINKDQQLDVVHSGNTHTKLVTILEEENFELQIYDFT